MNKFIKAAFLIGTFTLFTQPKKAEAFGLVLLPTCLDKDSFSCTIAISLVAFPILIYDSPESLIYLPFWPILLLDQKSPGISSQLNLITENSLTDNGYTPTQVQEILAGQKTLDAYLKSENKVISSEQQDSGSDVKTFLKSLPVELNDEYLNFVSDFYN